MIGDIEPLAKLLRVPYFPVTPLFPWLGPLGAIPLPSKWIIEFGKPILPSQLPAAEDHAAVLIASEAFRQRVQDMVRHLLDVRGAAF